MGMEVRWKSFLFKLAPAVALALIALVTTLLRG